MGKFVAVLFVVFLGMMPQKTVASSFDGSYRTFCLNLEDDDLISYINISNENFVHIWTAFEDSKCISPYLSYVEKFKFKLSGMNWDGVIVEVGYQPQTKETAQVLNEINWCGFSNWRSGAYKEVSGRTCGDRITPQVGDAVYSILREELSKPGFRLGQPTLGFDGRTPGRRHQKWSDFWHYQL